jgi:hypothetical protein
MSTDADLCPPMEFYSLTMEFGAHLWNMRVWLPMEYEGMYGIQTLL